MKTHILAGLLALATTLAATLTPATLAHAQTIINIANPPASGEGFTFAGGVVTINQGGDYIITGTTTSNRVVVGQVAANITLRDCSITTATYSALALHPDGCYVFLYMEGANTLQCTKAETTAQDHFGAGIEVENRANLIIEGGSGSLSVTGSAGAAGIGARYVEIGGSYSPIAGNITINGGRIIARSPNYGAAIGSGYHGDAGNITINGGVILAVSNSEAAAIGGGGAGGAGNIRFTGGTTFAFGSKVGIGPGRYDSGSEHYSQGSILIEGGTVVTNTALGFAKDNYGSAPTTTTITEGTVIAELINTTAFGNAHVTTGVIIPLATMQTLTDNIPYSTPLQPHITYLDTITLYRDTLHDTTTTHRDTLIHLTINLPTDTIWHTTNLLDTLWNITHHYDTTHFPILIPDTLITQLIIPDTLRDTLRQTAVAIDTAYHYIYDTLHTTLTLTDTLRHNITLIDTTLIPPTLTLHDTIRERRDIEVNIYTVIDPDNGNRTEVHDTLPCTIISNGYLLQDLTPLQPLAAYGMDGFLAAYTTSSPNGTALLHDLLPGTYLLWHSARWWTFTLPLQ